MISSAERVAVLARHAFFRDMPPAAVARCAAHARVVAHPAGARIFAKGDGSQGMMAVLSGLVRISVPSEGMAELTLNLIGPGDIFGEIALIDGQPRTADATALTPCRLLLLERRDFLAVLLDEPAAALALLQIVTARLRRTSRQLEQASFGPAARRLAQALVTLGRAVGADAERTTIRMPQRQIGNMIGLSRETTNRHLRAWQRAGVIGLEPGGLSIRDPVALERLAADPAEA